MSTPGAIPVELRAELGNHSKGSSTTADADAWAHELAKAIFTDDKWEEFKPSVNENDLAWIWRQFKDAEPPAGHSNQWNTPPKQKSKRSVMKTLLIAMSGVESDVDDYWKLVKQKTPGYLIKPPPRTPNAAAAAAAAPPPAPADDKPSVAAAAANTSEDEDDDSAAAATPPRPTSWTSAALNLLSGRPASAAPARATPAQEGEALKAENVNLQRELKAHSQEVDRLTRENADMKRAHDLQLLNAHQAAAAATPSVDKEAMAKLQAALTEKQARIEQMERDLSTTEKRFKAEHDETDRLRKQLAETERQHAVLQKTYYTSVLDASKAKPAPTTTLPPPAAAIAKAPPASHAALPSKLSSEQQQQREQTMKVLSLVYVTQ